MSPSFPAALFPTMRQDGNDVHGSHSLFYRLRSRGSGILLRNDAAAVVLTWRPDVGRLVALRPVGQTSAMADLLEHVAKLVSEVLPGIPFVARYCLADLTAALRADGWGDIVGPWAPDAPYDDEAFPEVIVTAEPRALPTGQRHKSIREAVFAHSQRFTYRAVPKPMGCGEVDFVNRRAARADQYDEHERGFNRSAVAALDGPEHDALTYHYLFEGDRLAGFAITGDTTGTSHGYFLAVEEVPRLATYFLWKIYLEVRRSGSDALNLGGSETASLHDYKTRTFPDSRQQRSYMLQYRGNRQAQFGVRA
ncbi:hypothetical protein [Microbispora triticiradicis]|uniref:hypothetical protein n=1 Tax=Microbispora TaxID=2005 RepID=UPI00142EA7D9|nr:MULTISPECIES: hypothetical protein [Microbispora]